MITPVPECPACRMRMQEGFVLDVGHNGRLLRTRWAEGQPERSLLKGVQVKGRRQFDTVTFRCPRCGWLVWFAPEPVQSDD